MYIYIARNSHEGYSSVPIRQHTTPADPASAQRIVPSSGAANQNAEPASMPTTNMQSYDARDIWAASVLLEISRS